MSQEKIPDDFPDIFAPVNFTRIKLTGASSPAIEAAGMTRSAMKSEARKAAVAAYKKRTSAPGIYAVRDAASGKVWVGRTADLATIENRVWFGLRHGGHSCRDLLAAWRAADGRGFAFERLEALEPQETPYVLDSLLKERLAHWRATLAAALL
jgi:hypothetical protein